MSRPAAQETSADLAVYGATAGGVAAAVAAGRRGLRVILAEPTSHVGGMLTGGLSRSDVERQEPLIGGLARAFFAQVSRRSGRALGWRFEPSAAAAVLHDWLDAAGVSLLTGWQLERVRQADGRIRALIGNSGSSIRASYAVDASYEGDLLAAAGVPYDVGRDGRERYGESLAGRIEMLPNPHQFAVPVSALAADGTLLPGVQPYQDIGPLGWGDGKLQSYCYRICLTDDPERRLPIAEPAGYDPERYVLVRRYLEALGDAAPLRAFLGLGRLPGGKVDVNSGGPVSTNLLGASWAYPEATANERRRIAAQHLAWAQGLLHFLSSDPAVSAAIRADMRRFGLPTDEFPRTGHWPPQLYIRDGRRMRGAHVLTQHDLLAGSAGPVPDAVGMAGYNIDIREVQWVAAPVSRFPDLSHEVLTEGYLSVPVPPYPLPYRALLPPDDTCDNLAVSTCISASHVAFASFRMEPQFLIAGHAAGVACALAAEAGCALRDVDIARLQAALRAEGQILPQP